MYRLGSEKSVGFFAICAIMCYLFINQGGYFAGGIISAGIITAIMLFRIKPEIKIFDLLFLAFSLWYLFCTLRTGLDIRYTSKGILPFLCLIFRWLIPKDKEKSSKLFEYLIKVSLFVTCVAIILCIISSIKSMHLIRLSFPMQYSNASGIFFGVMFILARYTEFGWSKKLQYVFFAALVLTQSVGAVGLTVIAEIILSKNKRNTLIFLIIIFAGAIVLHSRVIQSMGTFLERILQVYDGFRCMVANPVFGIGAGRWDLYKGLYQTGFYDSQIIHGTIGQIGAASGIIGLVLFVASAVYVLKNFKFENKAYLAGALMLVVHSFIDFTFSFTVLGFLAMLLISHGEEKATKPIEVKKYISLPMSVLILSAFVFLAYSMNQVKTLEKIDIEANPLAYVDYYETHPLSQKDAETTKTYAKALYNSGNIQKSLETLNKMRLLSTNMVVLKKDCTNSWDCVMEYIKIQPYNSPLYRSVYRKSNDEVLKKEVEKLLDDAINSMSVLGKKLHELKGDEIL